MTSASRWSGLGSFHLDAVTGRELPNDYSPERVATLPPNFLNQLPHYSHPAPDPLRIALNGLDVL